MRYRVLAVVVFVVGIAALLFVITHTSQTVAQWQITGAFVVCVASPLVTARLLMDAYEVGEL
ncbi:hypothetical protein [Bifidobacterium crudilactis]|jgi:hypothetical protein|uniref:hypothetical protein n=1 Tax=Bifidobacterium crudilactis TaxID=327277 RepID=UPI0023564105|nr:hypothetical protein [Bifidobacterium crudilactis]MCI2149324.1 hypothetical protein [Bifidobacterium crudilactis]MCI2158520.1 hypothetical protein [Bifidobacterium crudilactis]